MPYLILSIDAWADGEDGWTWNNWHKIGELEELPSQETTIQKLIDEGFLKHEALEQGYVEDDGYNLTIRQKSDDMPVFAIQYGDHT